jgi:hypothetical protein
MHTQEFFTLPVRLEPIRVLGNVTLFTSDSLKKKLIESLYLRGSFLKPVASELSVLIQKDIVVPCYMAKNLKQLIVKKLLSLHDFKFEKDLHQTSVKESYGFFSFTDKKVILLIDNNLKYVAFTSESLQKTLIHELMHYCANFKSKEFWNLFKDEISRFYLVFFSMYFDIGDPDRISDTLEKYSEFLYKKVETTHKLKVIDILKKVKLEIDKIITFSSFSSVTILTLVSRLLYAYKILCTNPILFGANVEYLQPIIHELEMTYKAITGKVPVSLPGQELLIPSEIICNLAEIESNKSRYLSIIRSMVK